jgi:glycosyltransferase involved in cell wall biosynthesis
MRIAIVGAQPDYITKLRGQLLRDLVAAGHEVWAVGQENDPAVEKQLAAWDVRYAVVPISRRGLDPVADFRTLVAFHRFFRTIRPDSMLVYTTKSIVWGMVGAWAGRVPHRFAMVAGRGMALLELPGIKPTILRYLTMLLLKISLEFAHGVVFQNEEDMEMFKQYRLIPRNTPLLRVFGSGVELDLFQPRELPEGPITFLLIGRLLKRKGIREFVAAATKIRAQFPDARFVVVGGEDKGPDAIEPSTLNHWRQQGIVDFRGFEEDVKPYLAASHVFVLPSIAEGVPRSALEALATGRAVITTNAAGCRDTVIENRNGALVEFGDADALAKEMALLAGNPDAVRRASVESRKIAEERFDARAVSGQIMVLMGAKE